MGQKEESGKDQEENWALEWEGSQAIALSVGTKEEEGRS